MIKVFALILLYLRKINKRLRMLIFRKLFCEVGLNVVFDPDDNFSFSTITVGSDVFIGPGAKFSATVSSIKIGDKVMFGPNVTIMGGDHNTSEIGRYMYDVHEKKPENDLPVIIEDDCWIGSNACILKGVTIATGCIVAAGALVTKSTEPFTIVGGAPARAIKPRFPPADLEKHVKLLGVK